MRRMFNDGGYWTMAQSGQLSIHVRRNVHLTLEKAHVANEPYCTHSQEVSYLNQNTEIVRLHQYLRENGLLGGSGIPDPKRMLVNGVLYRIRGLYWYEKLYSTLRKQIYKIIGR